MGIFASKYSPVPLKMSSETIYNSKTSFDFNYYAKPCFDLFGKNKTFFTPVLWH